MAYSGSCHCGAVTFTVEGDVPTAALSCNCSHCRRKGLLLSFVPENQFTIDSGTEGLQTYLFHKQQIEHQFCTTCGCQAFATGSGPDGSRMAAINLRCVTFIDLDTLELQKMDGASF